MGVAEVVNGAIFHAGAFGQLEQLPAGSAYCEVPLHHYHYCKTDYDYCFTLFITSGFFLIIIIIIIFVYCYHRCLGIQRYCSLENLNPKL